VPAGGSAICRQIACKLKALGIAAEILGMRSPAAFRGAAGRLTLTRQVALLSLLPMAVLGLALARVLQTQTVARTLADESQTARLIARIGIQPTLTPSEVRDGLAPAAVQALDRQLRTPSVKRDLARIKIWNADDTVVYSDDHSLIGRRLTPSDDLEHALAGRPNDAVVVVPSAHSETAGEVGLGTLVEVYVPLRFDGSSRPAGAFEMYLSYRPVAGAIAHEKTIIALLVTVGLLLLWLVIYRIVARASRTLRRQAADQYRLARYDRLTGLPNRTLFSERLDATLRGRERGAHTAVVMVDIDRFKDVNNTLGNATGDQVLRETARRLSRDLGAQTLLARLGNDEFAIVPAGATDNDGAIAVAAGVQRSLEAPMVLDGIVLDIELSVGIAASTDPATGAQELLQQAEAALARARAECSRVEVFSPGRDSFDPTSLILLGQVRAALERDEFVLHYQPKLDLASGTTSGVEALVRWRHPERGLLAPVEFVPLVEQTALVGPLTLHLVELAARQAAAWQELGLSLEMSVNLSARNLLEDELPQRIIEILRAHGVAPGQFTVEVTETATMVHADKAIAVLERLRELGVGVSIDDFGTGSASIDYLARLPATELKIDRSFITGICEDPRAEAIVRSTIDLARHLALEVVAEGIETPGELERLTALDCDTGQGYLISRPLPAEELTAQLLEQVSQRLGARI